MDGAVAAPPKQVTQWRWLVMTILLGAAGALGALAPFAHGTYAMGPLLVDLGAHASASGQTELAVNPGLTGLAVGHTESKTHNGFLGFRATVVNVRGDAFLTDAAKTTKDPQTFATFLRDDNKKQLQTFGLKVMLVALAGGAAGGAVIGLVGLRPRRILQGAIVGVLVVGVMGLIAYRSFDTTRFANTTFKTDTALTR